ncbi:GNAT family N-acetyltransferase [Kribbella sp. NPDC050241]|uniref:GNAT family N-acetyltransferase n=1 Tax=Kribbella sp. NPDC050241 TaxID=3364115 RepID=UPI00378C98C4
MDSLVHAEDEERYETVTENSRHLPGSYRLTGGEVTVGNVIGQTTRQHTGRSAVSVTARILDLDVMLANWEGQAAAADSVLPLTTFPLPLDSLPASVQIRIEATPASVSCVDGDWHIRLWFTDSAGRQLTWHCLARPGLDGSDRFSAPLAATLVVDDVHRVDPAASPRNLHRSPQLTTPTDHNDHVIAILDHPEDEYYEVTSGGDRVGMLVYHVIGTKLTITHTWIAESHRGQGLASVLIRHALDDIRTKSVTVSNYCPIVGSYIEKNPEYGDLLHNT